MTAMSGSASASSGTRSSKRAVSTICVFLGKGPAPNHTTAHKIRRAMKYLSSQFSVLFPTGETRTNLAALVKYFVFLIVLVSVYAVVFHVIMVRVEGKEHSWITGFYWTLVVMTTLGFGDITFTSDVGRLFSIVVLMSGVVFLLVMLPFLFIRQFYAPWLESRMRLRAPREVR